MSGFLSAFLRFLRFSPCSSVFRFSWLPPFSSFSLSWLLRFSRFSASFFGMLFVFYASSFQFHGWLFPSLRFRFRLFRRFRRQIFIDFSRFFSFDVSRFLRVFTPPSHASFLHVLRQPDALSLAVFIIFSCHFSAIGHFIFDIISYFFAAIGYVFIIGLLFSRY